MKNRTSILCAATLLAVAATAQARITRNVEKVFAVQPGGQLKADTQGGQIVIQTADSNEVRIVASQVVDTNSEDEATELLTRLKLTLEQQGNDVQASASYERGGLPKLWGNWPPVHVSYTVTVPRSFNLKLDTSGGDIKVAAVKGTIKAHTSGGNLSFDRVDGDIDGETSGGDVNLKEGTARANLSTSGGNIRIERAGGPTTVSTSGGNISIAAATQLLRATTSGGNIRAQLTESPRQDAVLSTSGGNVVLQVPKNAGFVLDAETSGGEVRTTDLTLTASKMNSSKTRLTATVNAGGPKLTLRTSGGDIRVRSE